MRDKNGRFSKGHKTWQGKKRPPFSENWKNKMSIARLKNKEQVNVKIGLSNSVSQKGNVNGFKKGESRFTREKHWNWKGEKSKNYLRRILFESAPRPKPKECEICSSKGRICLDHNHKTGKFRGWICLKCNVAIGMVGESSEILTKIMNYINNN